MKQKERGSDSQLMQMFSSLLAGVLLSFGVSVLLLFCAAHLVAAGRLEETGCVEGAASAAGCLCGGIYTALSCRRRMLLMGVLLGTVFYAAWTAIGLIGYAGTGVLDGVNSLVAAVAGGVTAGLLCAWLRPGRK